MYLFYLNIVLIILFIFGFFHYVDKNNRRMALFSASFVTLFTMLSVLQIVLYFGGVHVSL